MHSSKETKSGALNGSEISTNFWKKVEEMCWLVEHGGESLT